MKIGRLITTQNADIISDISFFMLSSVVSVYAGWCRKVCVQCARKGEVDKIQKRKRKFRVVSEKCRIKSIIILPFQ